jgi:hypothetical protein
MSIKLGTTYESLNTKQNQLNIATNNNGELFNG